MATKQELVDEAAFILEQEGWMLSRFARDTMSSRLSHFSDRYKAWQEKVKAYRAEHPNEWPEPPDNS